MAPELFLEPMDWITNRVAHGVFLGVAVGDEICTDLDCADYVSLLAGILKVLVLVLKVLHEGTSQVGLVVGWSRAKLQVFGGASAPPSGVSVLCRGVGDVDSFVSLGSCVDVHGGSEPDVCSGSGRPARA